MSNIVDVTGNLLDLFDAGDVPAIAHGCNCRGVMGSGIARQIRERYPVVYEQYRAAHWRGVLSLGLAMNVTLPDGRPVFNLMTQDEPGPNASLGAIALSVERALSACQALSLPSLGIPRLGAGIGGLPWPAVRGVLTYVTENSPSPTELIVVTLPEEVTDP